MSECEPKSLPRFAASMRELTGDQAQTLEAMWRHRVPLHQIASMMGLLRACVNWNARKLGLPVRGENRACIPGTRLALPAVAQHLAPGDAGEENPRRGVPGVPSG